MNSNIRILAWPAFKPKLSPYNALLYRSMQALGATVNEFTARRVLFGHYDVVHVHWPEYCVNERGRLSSIFWASALFTMVCWIRLRGGIVIWTVHNIESHLQQHPVLERYFWKTFTSLLNGYICLTEGGGERARQHHPALRTKPAFVIPHGNIKDAYPETDITREQARRRLGIPISTKVLGFFGSVQPYKGVTELAETFAATANPQSNLLIAGKCSLPPLERAQLEKLASADPRLILRLEYIPHADVACYIRAVDLVVLPFREILNSGSAILALALDRPVLLPDRGSMQELQHFAGHDWVRLYRGDLTPALLEYELDRAAARTFDATLHCLALQNGWNGLHWRDLAQLTLEAYDRVRTARGLHPATTSSASSPALQDRKAS